jgi:hypothetical protein
MQNLELAGAAASAGGVTHVAMEATGIYSMPVYHALLEHGDFREQLEGPPPAQRKDIVRAVWASGYPAAETLEEFRTLVAVPILHAPARPHAVQGTRRPRQNPHRR